MWDDFLARAFEVVVIGLGKRLGGYVLRKIDALRSEKRGSLLLPGIMPSV